jgi:starvation-inducible DNA-binding protein
MKPDIGLADKKLKGITDMLSCLLADAMLLYTKTRKFHWNVNGPSFMELHELFEKHYKKLEKSIDEIAERISKLGALSIGTMEEFLQLSGLKETPGKNPSQAGMLKELLQDHQAVIKTLRKKIDECEDEFGDKGTADFLAGLIQEHETMAWSLRRYLH